MEFISRLINPTCLTKLTLHGNNLSKNERFNFKLILETSFNHWTWSLPSLLTAPRYLIIQSSMIHFMTEILLAWSLNINSSPIIEPCISSYLTECSYLHRTYSIETVLEHQNNPNRIPRSTVWLILSSCCAGNIEIQRRETYNVESSLSNMQSDMIKLNTLLHTEKGMQVDLQQGNILMENDFIASLKVRVMQGQTTCSRATFWWRTGRLYCFSEGKSYPRETMCAGQHPDEDPTGYTIHVLMLSQW